MKLLRSRDIPEEKYTNAFLGYGPETTNFAGGGGGSGWATPTLVSGHQPPTCTMPSMLL